MYSVIVTDEAGCRTVRRFDRPEVTIGRDRTNDVVLLSSNVSKVHARLIQHKDAFVLIDNRSTNGTWVSGSRIVEPYTLRGDDKFTICEFTLQVCSGAASDTQCVAPIRGTHLSPPAPMANVRTTLDDSPRPQHVPAPPPADWNDRGGQTPPAVPPVAQAATPKSAAALDDGWVPVSESQVARAPESSSPLPTPLATVSSSASAAATRDAGAFDDGWVPVSESQVARAPDSSSSSTLEAELADCLRQYVQADRQSRGTGGDHACRCGQCFFCRARAVLARCDTKSGT